MTYPEEILEIEVYRLKGSASSYVAYWELDGKQGRAVSTVSPEQAAKNAVAQAKAKGLPYAKIEKTFSDEYGPYDY